MLQQRYWTLQLCIRQFICRFYFSSSNMYYVSILHHFSPPLPFPPLPSPPPHTQSPGASVSWRGLCSRARCWPTSAAASKHGIVAEVELDSLLEALFTSSLPPSLPPPPPQVGALLSSACGGHVQVGWRLASLCLIGVLIAGASP